MDLSSHEAMQLSQLIGQHTIEAVPDASSSSLYTVVVKILSLLRLSVNAKLSGGQDDMRFPVDSGLLRDTILRDILQRHLHDSEH